MKNYEVQLLSSATPVQVKASEVEVVVDSTTSFTRRTLVFKKSGKEIAWFNYEQVVFWRIII